MMITKLTDEDVIKAILAGNQQEIEMAKDPYGLRLVFKTLHGIPAGYTQIKKKILGEQAKKHVAFQVNGPFAYCACSDSVR